MAKGKFVSYLRVSTARQGRSGLGLEAQRQAVTDYLDGGRWRLLGEYVEIESGKTDDRPQLAAALHRAKVTGATLIVAKLDRLSRSMLDFTALTTKEQSWALGALNCAVDRSTPGRRWRTCLRASRSSSGG